MVTPQSGMRICFALFFLKLAFQMQKNVRLGKEAILNSFWICLKESQIAFTSKLDARELADRRQRRQNRQ